MKTIVQIIYDFFISEQGLQMDEGSAKINAKRLGGKLSDIDLGKLYKDWIKFEKRIEEKLQEVNHEKR